MHFFPFVECTNWKGRGGEMFQDKSTFQLCSYVYSTYCFLRNKEYILNMTQDATLVHMLNVVLSRGQ